MTDSRPSSGTEEAPALDESRLNAWRAERRAAEAAAIVEARRTGRNHVFMDEGTEVTATPSGHIFYNMADWY